MRVLTLIILAAAFQFCSPKSPNSELEKSQKIWQNSGVENYSFTCERVVGGTFSFRPEQIEVKKGEVVSRKTIDGSNQYNSYDGYSDIETVEKVFDVIRKSYDAGQKVEVTYNEKLGYPEEAGIDLLGPPDRPFTVKITNFKVN